MEFQFDEKLFYEKIKSSGLSGIIEKNSCE